MNPAEDLPDEVRTRAYYSQPVWKRIVVIAAGPAVNLRARVPAALRLLLRWWARRPGRATWAWSSAATRPRACCSRATASSRSTASGATPNELSRQIAAHECPEQPPTDGCRAREPVSVTVGARRAGAHARADSDLRPARRERTRLGFAYAPGPREPLPFGEAIDTTADRFWFITRADARAAGALFDPEKRKEISGVVGLLRGHASDDPRRPRRGVGILAIISLSLAIVNLFPFLPLDGGHIFWAIVEKIGRKPVPFSVMERAGMVGFMLVILIFLVGSVERHRSTVGRGLPGAVVRKQPLGRLRSVCGCTRGRSSRLGRLRSVRCSRLHGVRLHPHMEATAAPGNPGPRASTRQLSPRRSSSPRTPIRTGAPCA